MASSAKGSMFTPSGPHATSKSPARSSRINIGNRSSAPPPNETPSQKVARLRDAARRAKVAEESGFERVVTVGKVWADRAHRATTYGLIGFTAVAAIVVVYALGDMTIYNRKRRNEWAATLKAEYAKKLGEAQTSLDAGTATEAQIKFLEIEREEEAKIAAKLGKKGLWERTKSSMFGGYNLQEQKGGNIASGAAFSENASSAAQHGTGVVQAVEELVTSTKEAAKETLSSVQKSPSATRQDAEQLGGALDKLASDSVSDAKAASKSWWNWASGR